MPSTQDLNVDGSVRSGCRRLLRCLMYSMTSPIVRLSPRQRKEIQGLLAAGAEVHVVDNMLDVLAILRVEGEDGSAE